MDQGLSGTLSRMSYTRARQLVLAAGLGILLITALVMYVRRVDSTEVVGTLLFIPILVAFVFYDVKGGVIAGVGAAVIYIVMRLDAIDAVGFGEFAGLIISRSIAFVIFGAIGGWADRALEQSLTKLELYDQIDDYTGLYNARFFVQDVDLELSRSKRYQTVFSVSAVDFPVAGLASLSRRQRANIRKELGRLLQEAVRTVDRAAHGFDGARHRFAIVLPETGPEGARIFTERLADRLAAFLTERGASVPRDQVRHQHFTFPDDGEEPLQRLKAQFEEIDRHEHPEAPAQSA